MEFKKLKFKLRDVLHSEKIQKALFEAGYSWSTVGKQVDHLHAQYLYTESDGRITYGCSVETYQAASDYSYADIVETVAIVEKKVVSFEGKTYDEKEFLVAVSQLTPV